MHLALKARKAFSTIKERTECFGQLSVFTCSQVLVNCRLCGATEAVGNKFGAVSAAQWAWRQLESFGQRSRDKDTSVVGLTCE